MGFNMGDKNCDKVIEMLSEEHDTDNEGCFLF